MANHKQAKKRIRQTIKRTERNRARLSRVRTFIRRFEADLLLKDAVKINESLRLVMSEMQRASVRGIFHRNMVARKISRLNKRALAVIKG